MPDSSTGAATGGQVRVSAAVLDRLTTVAASEVPGVLHTESYVGGAVVGGVIGGAVGFAQGGPAGAAAAAAAGSVAGAAAAHLLHERRRQQELAPLDGDVAPELDVRIVARYGEDLHALAEQVRGSVEAALRETLGLRPSAVRVEVVDVADPGSEPAPAPYPGPPAPP